MAWKLGDPVVINPTKKPVTPVAATTPKPTTGVVPPTPLNPYTNGPNAVMGAGGAASAVPKPATTPMAASPTPVMNAATNTNGVVPSLGYGSGGTYGQTPGLGQAYAANAALISTDAGKQSEIARTQQVIADRKAQGLDTSGQEKYLSVNLGYQTPQEAVKAPEVGTTSSGGNYPILTPNQINQEAQYQIDKERSDLQTAADTQTGAIKNNAAYANKLLTDSRVLSDFTASQSVNPFSNMGKRSFDEGLKQRQRSIDDTYTQANLSNELNSVQKDLYNFDKLAPDKQRTLVNEMTRIERDYGLQVGSLTGQIPGMGAAGQTLASKEFEWSKDPSNPSNVGQDLSNQMTQLQLNDYPEQSRSQAQLVQQQLESGKISNEAASYQLNELKNPNSVSNQAAALDLKMKQLEANNLPETQKLQLQQLRKSIANIGRTAPTSDYDKQMQDIKLKTAQAEYDKLIAGGDKPKVPYQQSPDFAADIQAINNGSRSLKDVTSHAEELSAEYGYDGYLALLKAATPED